MHSAAGAIAAFDDHGVRHNITIHDKVCLENSQKLNVGWRYILNIVARICLLQLGALCFSLTRRRICDENFLSAAILLQPVITAIAHEPGATAMSGDEIENHHKLRSTMLKYSYKEGRPGESSQLAVVFKEE